MPGGTQGAGCPVPRQLAVHRAAWGGCGLVAAGWGYGWQQGLLLVRLWSRPRREEGAEAHPGPWWDLLASSHHEEPGHGMAWLMLGYVPLLEDDLPLPGCQLCLIVPESP